MFEAGIYVTLPETNIAPENGPSQRETSIPTIHFQGQTASFRESSFQGCIIFTVYPDQCLVLWSTPLFQALDQNGKHVLQVGAVHVKICEVQGGSRNKCKPNALVV